MKTKSQIIGKRLTENSSTSREMMREILKNIKSEDKDGCFNITVDGKNYTARQLG